MEEFRRKGGRKNYAVLWILKNENSEFLKITIEINFEN